MPAASAPDLPPGDAAALMAAAPPFPGRVTMSNNVGLGDGPVEALMREDPAEQPWDAEVSAEAVKAASLPALDLDAIEARDSARTQGRWWPGGGVIHTKDTQIAVVNTSEPWAPKDPPANAAFIAAASVDVPALCAEVRRLRDVVRTQADDIFEGRMRAHLAAADLEQTRGEFARLRGAAAALALVACGDAAAGERIEVPAAEYRALRALLPGSLEGLAGGSATPDPSPTPVELHTRLAAFGLAVPHAYVERHFTELCQELHAAALAPERAEAIRAGMVARYEQEPPTPKRHACGCIRPARCVYCAKDAD